MLDLARLIQTAQICYKYATEKRCELITLKVGIENKILIFKNTLKNFEQH